jgi:HAD superfamily hydrolase (TIGR01509 family)
LSALNGAEIRAVIFDCDGVLFESDRANVEYFNEVLARLGRPRMDAVSERMAKMMASPQLMAALLGDDEALIARAREIARGVDYDPFYQFMLPVPGLPEILEELSAMYRLAMATNRGTTVPGVLQRFDLGRFFELAVGILDVPRPKPFPDMLEKCAAHFGIDPREAVYVGDSPTDFDAARAAGMQFVGIGDGTGAPLRIEALSELGPLLNGRHPRLD